MEYSIKLHILHKDARDRTYFRHKLYKSSLCFTVVLLIANMYMPVHLYFFKCIDCYATTIGYLSVLLNAPVDVYILFCKP